MLDFYRFKLKDVDLSLSLQPLIQPAQLSKETVVWSNFSFLPHQSQSAADVHVLPQHQEGHDQGGGAAVALPAVDQHPAWTPRPQHGPVQMLHFTSGKGE